MDESYGTDVDDEYVDDHDYDDADDDTDDDNDHKKDSYIYIYTAAKLRRRYRKEGFP